MANACEIQQTLDSAYDRRRRQTRPVAPREARRLDGECGPSDRPSHLVLFGPASHDADWRLANGPSSQLPAWREARNLDPNSPDAN